MKNHPTRADQFEMAGKLIEEFNRVVDATGSIPRFASLGERDKDRIAAIVMQSRAGRELVADTLLNDNFLANQLTSAADSALHLANRYCEIRSQIFLVLEDTIDTEIDAFNSDGDYRSSLFACGPMRMYVPHELRKQSPNVGGEVTPEFANIPAAGGEND